MSYTRVGASQHSTLRYCPPWMSRSGSSTCSRRGPFAGNQLCVVPEPPGAGRREQMQARARDRVLRDDVRDRDPGRGYDVRIFTPDAELPFAGHPTLGTAFTLASEGRTSTRLIQTSAAGDVPVEVDLGSGMAWMAATAAAFGDGSTIATRSRAAAGLEPDDLVEGCPRRGYRPVSRI